jgi:predicted phosphodiesterase
MRAVRIHVLSDLHLSVAPLERPQVAADVVVPAGDIARPRDAVEWARGFDVPVLYVPGNHEFYGGAIEDTVAELRERCAGTQVHVLERDEVRLNGVRSLGTTLVARRDCRARSRDARPWRRGRDGAAAGARRHAGPSSCTASRRTRRRRPP